MRNTHTSVLARRVRIDADFATLPYEAGWASEAVFFTQVEGAHPELAIITEISPDGIHWVQQGDAQTLSATDAIAASTLTIFGNWIRLVIRGATPDRPARILVHLSMKG